MNPKILTALVGLMAAIIATKIPALGDQAQTIAAMIVTFIVGWLIPAPGTPTPPDVPPKVD